jgi:hypothetical protein
VNWKNVLLLISTDVKSYRLVGGKGSRKFRENRFVSYVFYMVACLLGVSIGWLIGNFYSGITDPQFRGLIFQGAVTFFISFPTIALLYGLIFTQMNQFQRIGAKVSIQPLYWFPVTWGEHTLASIIANILGFPLGLTICIISGIAVASIFLELIPIAILTIYALLVSVFMASATTEASRILQVRASGAITKAAGRAAIWVRLIGSILFFIVFYAVYFSLYYQTSPILLLEMVSSGQRLVWFIPYVWPGIALSYMASGSILETLFFSVASIVFVYVLFLAATKLNVTYGLYEMPAIRISKGVYVSRAGLLGRLGLPPLEAAVMRKDFKAFTRRLELAYIFLLPVVFAIMPILSAMRTGGQGAPPPYVLNSFLFIYLTLMPGTLMAMMLGAMMIGLEGGSVWYIYSSPINAKSLVKAKYLFAAFFSFTATLVCIVVGGIVWTPSSATTIIIYPILAVFLVFPLSMVSVSFGLKGPDFREYPRPRMIRPKWSLINGLVCILLALAIVSPIIPYTLNFFFEATQAPITISLPIPEAYPFIALSISGILACAVAYAFYHTALKNAEQFLVNAKEPYE